MRGLSRLRRKNPQNELHKNGFLETDKFSGDIVTQLTAEQFEDLSKRLDLFAESMNDRVSNIEKIIENDNKLIKGYLHQISKGRVEVLKSKQEEELRQKREALGGG